MKKIIFLFLMISSTAYANWTYYASTTEMNVYITQKNYVASGNIVKAWDLAEFKNVAVTGTKAQESYREYDCKKGTTKILKMKTYDRDGKLTDSYGFLPDWHGKPKRNSIGESLFNFYCR